MLVATASVGAGHSSVAGALVDAISRQAGEFEVEQIDVMDFAPRAFRLYYARGYAAVMSRFPRLYGLGFRLTNRTKAPGRGLFERRRLWWERLWFRRLKDHLLHRRPWLFVNTHFLLPPMVGRMIRRGEIRCRQIVVVTDISVHRFWYAEHVERWFVPSEDSAKPLRRWGISDERITVSGIPIHAKWTQPLDRAALLADWKLPSDRRIITLTGGTDFTCGPVAKIAQSLLDTCPGAQIIVLAGRNHKLEQRLSSFPESGKRMTVVPYTDRAHELIEVSSLVITKAGGVTTAECLAKGKPMLIIKPVPGQEAGNAAFLQRHGAAVIAGTHAQVALLAGRLLADDGELARISASALRLYRPGTETVVSWICRAASQEPGDPSAPASCRAES